MTDWAEKRRQCKKCHGMGYIGSSYIYRRALGYSHGSVQMCECQPQAMDELAEAAAQEKLSLNAAERVRRIK